RGIRLQRRTGQRWRLLSGGEQSGAQIRQRPIELAPGPGVVVEGGLGVALELQRRRAGLAELCQQRRHLVRETGAELALCPQSHLGAETPGPFLEVRAESAFQRAQGDGLARLAQEPAPLRFVEDVEPRIDPRGSRVPAQDLAAERVDGPDLRQAEVAADAPPERGTSPPFASGSVGSATSRQSGFSWQ